MGEPASACFSLLGRRVEVDGDDALVRELAERLGQHPGSNDQPVPWTLRVHQRHGLPRGLADGATQVEPDGRRVGILGPNAFVQMERGQLVHAEVDEDGATVEAYGSPFRAHAALASAIYEVLRGTGLHALHASAVSNGERTALFVGPSGRGKTTTLLHAVVAGWRPMAEDSVILDGDSLRLYALDRSLRLLGDGVDVVRSAFAGVHAVAAQSGKWEVTFDQLGVERVDDAIPTDVVLLTRTPGSVARFERVQPSNVVMALWLAAGAGLVDGVRPQTAAVLGRLAERVRGWELQLGDGPIPFDQLSEA